MLDFKEEIKSTLSNILPTYYEMVVDSDTPTPCITYIEYANAEDKQHGEKIYFSQLGYTIKIWVKKEAGKHNVRDLTNYANQVDLALKKLDYQRTSSSEYNNNGVLCKIMRYSTYAEEHI